MSVDTALALQPFLTPVTPLICLQILLCIVAYLQPFLFAISFKAYVLALQLAIAVNGIKVYRAFGRPQLSLSGIQQYFMRVSMLRSSAARACAVRALMHVLVKRSLARRETQRT